MAVACSNFIKIFPEATLHEECYFKVLGFLESNPRMSQSDLYEAFGVSLEETNCCLKLF
jgi:hypothetical protein